MLDSAAMEHTPEILDAIKQAEAKGDKPFTIAFAVLVLPGDVEGYSLSLMAPNVENAIIVGMHNIMERYKEKLLDSVVIAAYNGLHQPIEFIVPANDLGTMKPQGTA